MKVYHRCSPDSIETSVDQRVIDDVSRALHSIATRGKQFVVNDSEWFTKRASGRLTPCVMNAATFLSQTFQNTLADVCRWEKERELSGQKIDAYLELPEAGRRLRIPATSEFIEFFQVWCEHFEPEDLRSEFLACWHRFVQRGVRRRSDLHKKFCEFLKKTGKGIVPIRIGLEFETGNIASSFRALDKLETLFVMGLIDYGVFITSIDKEHSAARIWPASNRNGSFWELENRNYRNNRTVPLWEFGFAPDRFDQSAAYFNNTNLYEPVPTGRGIKYKGVAYEVFKRGGDRLLRLASPQ